MPKHAASRGASPAHSINFGTVDDHGAVLSSSPAAQPSAGKHLQGGNPTVFGSVAANEPPADKKGKKLDFQKLFQGGAPAQGAPPAAQGTPAATPRGAAAHAPKGAGPDKVPQTPSSQPGTPLVPGMPYPGGPAPWQGAPMYPHVGYPMSPGGFPYMPQQGWPQQPNSPHLGNMPASPMHAANSPRGPAMMPRPGGAQPFYPPASPSPNFAMNVGARTFEPQKSKALRIVNPETHTELDLEQVRQKTSAAAAASATSTPKAAHSPAPSSHGTSAPGTPKSTGSSGAAPASASEQNRVKTQADFQQRVLKLKMEREKAEREKEEKERAEKEAAARAQEEKERAEREEAERAKAEAEKAEREKAEREAAEKKAAEEKAEREAAEKKAAEEKAEREAAEKKAAEEKAAEEKAAAEKAAAEKAAAEKAAAEKAAAEKAAADKAAADKAAAEKTAADKAAAEKAAADEAAQAKTEEAAPAKTEEDASAKATDTAADAPADDNAEASTSAEPNRAIEHAAPIQDLGAVHYPESVQAPDAKLNVAAPPGKFRGRTSEERFAAASRGGFGGSGPMGAFGGRGHGMSRGGSGGPLPSRETMGTGVPMGARPKSNRGRQRGPHVNPPEKGGPTIPLDQVVPLAFSENRWKPQSLDESARKEADQPLQVERKVKSLLNKLTVEKFESISDQIVAIANQSANESDGRTLRQVIALVFEKAIDEAAWSEMYAQLCAKIQVNLNPDIKDEVLDEKEGKEYRGGFLFRKYLLTWCQGDFEKGWGAAKEKKPGNEPELLSDEYYAEQKAKRRGLGLVQFVGELFKLQMLQPRIMHTCIVRLLRTTTEPEEDEIESVCRLLTTVGALLDAGGGNNKSRMDVYFKRIDDILQSPNISSRMRFMLLDVIDLRNNNWVSRHDTSAPKTIAEIHAEAAKKQQQKEAEKFSHGLPRGGSRRGQPREQAHHSADGWSTVGGGAQPPPRTGRAGDLSGFGKGIDRSAGGKLGGGPQSIFSRKNQKGAPADADNRSPSRGPNAGNMFNLLNASHEGGDEAPQRPKLQLQPRSKPSGDEEHGEADAASAEPSEEDLKRKVSNDVKEYLAIRDLNEGVQSIEALPEKHRALFVDALVAAVLDKKPDTVQDAGKLLKTLRERSVLTEEMLLEGFKPQLTYLDDTSMDAPSAYSFMAQLLVDAELTRDQIATLGDVMEGEGIKPPKYRLLAKVDDLL
ncbi:hypothetical protein CBS14141_002611 [Malassezia furfur]|nr:hypothetical protein CBS14141_002611 [Malassezia furfur]